MLRWVQLSDDQSKSLLGSDRFVIERRLGEGSMGAVYLAYDREQKTRIALKTLRRVDALGIYRFKREFRALADLSHPNLVTLHELFSEGEQWFFTMQYIAGKDFLSYVLGSRAPGYVRTPSGSEPNAFETDSATHPLIEPRIEGLEMLFPTPLREPDKLRAVLRQITEGLVAVHGAGKLHRDLKPDNVLVTAEGRAVLLDFGIVSDDDKTEHRTLEPGVLGTPAYMSPEQGAGHAVDEASDFYALGSMLYEALTGSLPFDGTYTEILRQKQESEPVRPSLIVSGVPDDLDALCMSLLAHDPAARPSAAAVLHALRAPGSSSIAPASLPPTDAEQLPFVGRDRELSALARAVASTDTGKPVVMLVSGASGIGKTTLFERFASDFATSSQAVVLKGRCYERESLPFKAVDSLIDSLSRYLRRLSPIQAAEVMPRDIVALAQLFPVLRRVEEILRAKRRGPLPSDPQELRRRAFSALAELLSRIADRTQLVLFIDDLQWGDVDSAKLILDLLTGNGSPSALLVCAYRDGEAESSACVRTLLSGLAEAPQLDVRHLQLTALTPEQSVGLLRALLPQATPWEAQAVGDEARGSPYLLIELVRHVHERGAAELGPVSLENALQARLEGLSADARMLLQLVSVAGRPVPEETLTLASAFDIDLQAALSELRAAKLVRGVAVRNIRAIETYHDRIRETVVAGIAPALLRVWHRRLASTLEASGSLDLEALTKHLLGAGERVRAGLYALRAAAQAERALAFDKAARLYELAAEHYAPTGLERREVLMRWGDALVSAGRGAQAARVYFEASALSAGGEAAELRRKAGVQLVLGGHLDAGIEILRETLRELGVELPNSFREAYPQLIALRAELSARGLDFSPRAEDAVRVSALRRLDVLWAVTLGLLINEIDRPLPLVLRYLLDALDAGEPMRVIMGLCLHHAFVEVPLSRHDPRPELATLAAAEALARTHDSPEARAWVALSRACGMHHQGQWQPALVHAERAEETFRAQGTSGVSEMRLCRQLMTSLYVIFEQLSGLQRAEQWTHEAEERDDLLVATRLRVLTSFTALVQDDSVLARRQCMQAMQAWRSTRFDLTALAHWAALAMIELYEGDHAACAERVQTLTELERSPFGSIPLWRARVLVLRARAALTAARAAATPELLLRRAEADLEACAQIGLACFEDDVRIVRAGLLFQRGQHEAALALVSALLDSQHAQQRPLLLASALRSRGELLGGQNHPLVIRADAMLLEHGVVHPARMARIYAPSFAHVQRSD